MLSHIWYYTYWLFIWSAWRKEILSLFFPAPSELESKVNLLSGVKINYINLLFGSISSNIASINHFGTLTDEPQGHGLLNFHVSNNPIVKVRIRPNHLITFATTLNRPQNGKLLHRGWRWSVKKCMNRKIAFANKTITKVSVVRQLYLECICCKEISKIRIRLQ